MYPVSRYSSIDSATSPSITADGDPLFLQDTTGTSQVEQFERIAAFLEEHVRPEK